MTYLELFDPEQYIDEFSAFLTSIEFSDRNPLNTEMFFLWCMIRAQRPALFIESGTFRGYSANFICEALARNDDEVEFITIGFNLDDCLPYARRRLARYPFARVVEADSRTCLAMRPPEPRRTAFFIDGPKGRNMLPLFAAIRPRFTNLAFLAVHDCERESTSGNRRLVRQYYGFAHPILHCGSDFQVRYQALDEPLIGRSELVAWRPFHFGGVPRASYGSETAYVLPGRGRPAHALPRPLLGLYRRVVCGWLRGAGPAPPEAHE